MNTIKNLQDNFTSICSLALLNGASSQQVKAFALEMSNAIHSFDDENFITKVNESAQKIFAQIFNESNEIRDNYVPNIYLAILNIEKSTNLQKIKNLFQQFSQSEPIDLEIHKQIDQFFNAYFNQDDFEEDYEDSDDDGFEEEVDVEDAVRRSDENIYKKPTLPPKQTDPIQVLATTPGAVKPSEIQTKEYLITYFLEEIRKCIFFDQALLVSLVDCLFINIQLSETQFQSKLYNIIRYVPFEDMHQKLTQLCMNVYNAIRNGNADQKKFLEQLEVGLELIKGEIVPLLNEQICQQVYEILLRDELQNQKKHNKLPLDADEQAFHQPYNALPLKRKLNFDEIDSYSKKYAKGEIQRPFLKEFLKNSHQLEKKSDLLRHLLISLEDPLNPYDENGSAIIHEVILQGCPWAVADLVECSCEINMPHRGKNNMSILDYTLTFSPHQCKSEMFIELFKHGVPLPHNRTLAAIFSFALTHEDAHLINYMICNGALINAQLEIREGQVPFFARVIKVLTEPEAIDKPLAFGIRISISNLFSDRMHEETRKLLSTMQLILNIEVFKNMINAIKVDQEKLVSIFCQIKLAIERQDTNLQALEDHKNTLLMFIDSQVEENPEEIKTLGLIEQEISRLQEAYPNLVDLMDFIYSKMAPSVGMHSLKSLAIAKTYSANIKRIKQRFYSQGAANSANVILKTIENNRFLFNWKEQVLK